MTPFGCSRRLPADCDHIVPTLSSLPATLMPATLPAATADPTGPTGGPGGDAGGANGGQFQPPGMPNAHGGDNGGNYPAPPQGDGIDINNPSAPPEYSQAPQYTGTAPTGQQPVHGTQPPDYDHPVEQPAQASHPPQPTQAPREPRETQQQSNNLQRNQQCQDAAQTVGVNVLIGAIGGGGRSLNLPAGSGPWKLDPAAPTPSPPCTACNPATAQKQPPSNDDLQKQIDDLKKSNEDLHKQIDDSKKCSAGHWMNDIFGIVGGSAVTIAGVLTAETGLGAVIAVGGAVATTGLVMDALDCARGG